MPAPTTATAPDLYAELFDLSEAARKLQARLTGEGRPANDPVVAALITSKTALHSAMRAIELD
jgi:hypothetical protein